MVCSSPVVAGVTLGLAYVVFTNGLPNNRFHATGYAGA